MFGANLGFGAVQPTSDATRATGREAAADVTDAVGVEISNLATAGLAALPS